MGELSPARLRTRLGVRSGPAATWGATLHALVVTFNVANSIVLVLLAALAIRLWRNRRDVAAGWLALAFVAMALIVTVGRLVPAHAHGFLEYLAQRSDTELLVLFPYLLYRFATQFTPPGRRLQLAVTVLTISLSVGTFATPRFPAAGEHWPVSFAIYAVAFLVHWSVLSIAVAVRLWRAGSAQPSVASHRMRMLAFASAALTVALLASVFSSDQSSPGQLFGQALAFVAILAFYLGIEPPQLVRAYWRLPEQTRMQEATRDLVTLAMTRREIAARVAAPAADIVGARGLEICGPDGEVLAAHGETGAEDAAVVVEQVGVTVRAWTSDYAPFFGGDEVRLLETITAMTATALDRVRLFEQEHDARVALERANEVMTNFVALAAHELRTPVTTIHGFVQTLNHLGQRLDEAQRDELRTALEQQTKRMAGLVEQLLDLSRLDADAVQVRPQRLDVSERLHDVVSVAAGARASEVDVEVDGEREAVVDPQILDHIVSNLVTNALRYGGQPIHVKATSRDGRVVVSVEDSGPGVAREIEETLFERFTRAGVARDRVAGTGLGLAIARAYARAHRGDLRYERCQPSGSRFVVDLPTV